MEESDTSPLAPVRETFRAVVVTVVPEARDLDREGWEELESIVGDALSDRPEPMRRQFRIFLRAIRWLPVLRWARPFPTLDAARRRRFLAALQDAPVLLVRRGFWGVRTLAFMGYYGRDEARRAVGYDARLRGRRDRDVPTRGRGRGTLPETTPGAG